MDEIKLTHKHELESSLIADKILSEINYPEEEKNKIKEIITYHDTRTMPVSQEERIVKDADKLSRYTPECFEIFYVKLNKTEQEFFEILQEGIEEWLHTDTAKFLARKYLLKRRLTSFDIEFEKGIMKEFFEFLIGLEGEIVKMSKGHFEKIAIMTAREKVQNVKKMMEIYLDRFPSAEIEALQKDEGFVSIATQRVGENGYIGVIDRETKRIIFHPDKKIVNQPVERLKEEYRPSEYLHHFWQWHERAYRGEEFYSYYQGINKKNEIIDKFQYVLPMDIKNRKWALVAAIDYEDFFKPINILSTNIIQMIDKICHQMVDLTLQIEEANKKLIETERLSAVAQIASEAAHEVKNPLQVIKTGLYLLKMILPEENIEVANTIQQIDNAIVRANGFITDLLHITRPIELKKNKININQMLKQAIDELPKDLISTIELGLKLGDNLPNIEVDCLRLKQVIVNLVKNGIEGMEGVADKILEITTEKENEFIKISISDTGRGIPGDKFKKIFEPFYTTKGKGIGLGLCICKRFIDAHQGSIDVESKVGVGTRFIIKLPT